MLNAHVPNQNLLVSSFPRSVAPWNHDCLVGMSGLAKPRRSFFYIPVVQFIILVNKYQILMSIFNFFLTPLGKVSSDLLARSEIA
jgi:hypothetical protein